MSELRWLRADASFVEVANCEVPAGGCVNWLQRANDDDDARLRVAHWPTPHGMQAKGTVLLLGGYAEFIEKYFETVGNLLQRGFAVLTFDWRGQGMSSRVLTDDDDGFHRGYIESFDVHLSDLQLVVSYLDSLALPGPQYLIAHSMGGNLALRLLQDQPHRFEKVVLSAPMLGLIGIPTWFVCVMSSWYCRQGRGERYAWGSKPLNLAQPVNVVTSCTARFERTMRILRKEPQLLTSGVTWGWLRAAANSMRHTKKRAFLRSIDRPVLLFSAGRDRLVGRVGHRRLKKCAQRVRHVVLDESLLERFTEVDSVRNFLWQEIDEFFDVRH